LFDDSHAAAPAGCVTATIDGAARGNPGPAACGVVFEDSKGKVLAQLSARLGRATNNVAEYRALLAALTHAREQGWRALRVRTDSELLANQVRGRFKVKNPDLKLLHAEAHRLAAGFDFFAIEAVPRKFTRAADKLANAALDGRSAISRQPSAKPPSPAPSSGHGFSRAERTAKKEGASAPEVRQTIRAVYHDGVLRPLEPLDLPDATEVELILRRPPKER
jgi:ribonuclease HI